MYDLSRKTKKARGDNALDHRMGEGRRKKRREERKKERKKQERGLRSPFESLGVRF